MDLQFFSDYGHQDIDADRDPNLCLDGVGRGTEERLDSQVLLDPFEEQFHRPSALIQLGDCKGRQGEVISQKDEALTFLRIKETDAPERGRVEILCLITCQADNMVAAKSGCSIGEIWGQLPHYCVVSPTTDMRYELGNVWEMWGEMWGQCAYLV